MEAKNRLKLARIEADLNQAEFGAPLGLSQANVRDLESGKVKISTLHALAIEKIHGISSVWLLSGEGLMKRSDTVYQLAETDKNSDSFTEQSGEEFIQKNANDDHVRAAILGEIRALKGRKLRKFLRYLLEELDNDPDLKSEQ